MPETPLPVVERASERELVTQRRFAAPAAVVFAAWSRAELFSQWWLPEAFGLTLVSCTMDVRTGGSYRLEIGHPAHDQPMTFFGTYVEVVPDQKIVWTNAESDDGAVTTVTFAEQDGSTLVTVHERYPSAAALEDEIASGAATALPQQLEQLATFLATSAV